MRYYYGQLSRPLQGVYDALLGGFRALAPGIRIPMLDEKQLADVYLRLKLDEPLLFYVTGYRCRWMTGAAHMELLPEYLFDKAKIRTHQQAVSARLARLTKPLEGKTEAEKELAVHDFILENVRYDKLKKPYSHEILGPMTQGVGVCEGIAKTVKALCDQLGLWCIVALSEADPARGIKYRHTWNVVRVGGQYYHLDATFDNSLQRGEKRYDYYNLDDGRLFRDHERLVLPVPACTDGKGFYYRNVSFTKPKELEKRLAQALRKKQPLFVFHWRGGGLNRDTLQQLLALAGRLAAERGKRASCSVNFPQAVIQLEFSEAPQESITIQQANEAEALSTKLIERAPGAANGRARCVSLYHPAAGLAVFLFGEFAVVVLDVVFLVIVLNG